MKARAIARALIHSGSYVGNVPDEVNMYLDFKKFGVLPHSGGWNDQTFYNVTVLRAIADEFIRVEGEKQ